MTENSKTKANAAERLILETHNISFRELEGVWYANGNRGHGGNITNLMRKPLSPRMKAKFIDRVGYIIAQRAKGAKNG